MISSQRWLALACAAAIAAGCAGQAGEVDIPNLERRVSDHAGLLSSATVTRLEERLGRLEQSTGVPVAVLTVADTAGLSIEDYSTQVAEKWRSGRSDADGGVLIVVAVHEKMARIEVGNGLASRLSDARAEQILSDSLLPQLSLGDFDGGLSHAVTEIDTTIRGDGSFAHRILSESGDASGNSGAGQFVAAALVLAILLLGIAFRMPGSPGWVVYALAIPAVWLTLLITLGFPTASLLTVAWIIGLPAIREFLLDDPIYRRQPGPPIPPPAAGVVPEPWSQLRDYGVYGDYTGSSGTGASASNGNADGGLSEGGASGKW